MAFVSNEKGQFAEICKKASVLKRFFKLPQLSMVNIGTKIEKGIS
jgi:hypothetical protein